MELWQQQTDKPLYPDVIWSRPETAHGAGKLLIIGGSAGNMAGLARSHAEAEKAGAGTISILVPDSLAKVTKQIPHIQYGPSNPSGGFARSSLVEFLSASQPTDGVLLAGDMGKNSETSVLLESYIAKYSGVLIISPDAIQSFACGYSPILNRKLTIIALTLSQLRSLVIELKLENPVTSDIGKPELAKILSEITKSYSATLIIENSSGVWIAKNGRVAHCSKNGYSTAKSAVWAIQQPEKLYETIVSSCTENPI